MKTRKSQGTGGLLVKTWRRPKGKMEKNGKIIEWVEGFQIVIVEFEGDQIKKYLADPACADQIEAQLDAVHWGALIELELSNKKVVRVNVLEDALKDFYENN